MTFNPIRTRNAISGLAPESESPTLTFGTVTALNADGSVQVKVGAQSTRCTPHGLLKVNDRVEVIFDGSSAFAWIIGDDSELPRGGTSGQVLSKASGADFDVAWTTPTGGGGVSHTYALSGSGMTTKLTQDNGEEGNAGTFTPTLPDATTSAKGAVQLLTATDSTSETKAATPKAVMDAIAAAKSYTDSQIVAAGAVTGVKGSNEEDYRHGNVSLSYSDVGAASSTHVHGSIANDGSISSDTAVATGDKLVITDASDGAKVKRSGVSIDTTDTSKYLRHDGSWSAPPQPTVPTAYTSTPNMDGIASAGSSTKWARGDHTHPTDTSRAAASHTHDSDGIWYDSNHEDTVQDVLDSLDTALGNKANASHTHSISDVTGLQSALDGKAPTDHSDAATTYGKGTDGKYGHVLLSDSTSSSTAASNGGTAATPKAVKDAYDKAATALSTANSAVTGLDDKAAKTEAIKDISRSGVTFTATRCDNTTFTFTQKDTTYSTMTDAQADAGTQTVGMLISPKLLADYVAAHQGGGQSYDTLYYSLAGSHDNITLSATAANYDHMRIYFEKDSQTEACASIDVYKPNGRNVSTVLANVYSGGVQFLGAVWYINGTSITRVDNEAWANCASGITGGNTSSYTIQIFRVEAW